MQVEYYARRYPTRSGVTCIEAYSACVGTHRREIELTLKCLQSIIHTQKFNFPLCFCELVPNMTNYIFSPHLQLSNGKRLFLQQETTSYVSDFPLNCSDHSTLLCNCDHSNLMERDPYCPAAGMISATQISHTVLLFWDFPIVFGVRI